MKVAIIGAGAAGCFCAVNLKRMMPKADITIYERGRKPMAKLALTGGGRCNITNTFSSIEDLRMAYPRGWQLIRRLFYKFGPQATWQWWENEGVALVAQEDGCVFPRSQDAMQVVNTLHRLIRGYGIQLCCNTPITDITTLEADDIVVTTGGSPRMSGLSFLDRLHLSYEPPVPSLFALNVNDASLHALTGIVVEDCHVCIAGTKYQANGSLLITHFGMSGPAILRLSSYAARHLASHDYAAQLSVNWMQGLKEDDVRRLLSEYTRSGKQITNQHPTHLTTRHWLHLLQRAGISQDRRWATLNRKELNRLISILTADEYPTCGRRTYKAEFVTCGGVSLSDINPQTLECKAHPHLYFAGEVLDVDAITGGFNLQAAWTMGYTVAQAIAQKYAN